MDPLAVIKEETALNDVSVDFLKHSIKSIVNDRSSSVTLSSPPYEKVYKCRLIQTSFKAC